MAVRHLKYLTGIAVLAAAMTGGWFATNLFQKTVPLVPGVQGCFRLDGIKGQTTCLSEEFRSGAAKAAEGRNGDRDQAIAEYVRRADRLAATDPALGSLCHSAMHNLGRDEGARAARQENPPTFPNGASQLCTAGYVHGLAEGYLGESSSADLQAVFPKLCHDATAREGCAHGIGHGLLREESSDWLKAAPSASSRCDQLQGEYPSNCKNGVFMELAMRTTPRHVPVDDYVAVCDSAEDVESSVACWSYLAMNLGSNEVALTDYPKWCSRADLPGEYGCIDGYGRQLGVARVKSCEMVRSRGLIRHCINGALGLQIGSGHVDASTARKACERIADPEHGTFCGEAVKRFTEGRKTVEGHP